MILTVRPGVRSASLQGAGSASSILGVSSELIAEGSEISRLIPDIFTVGSTKELADVKGAMNAAGYVVPAA